MAFNFKNNKDQVFIRSALVAAISDLNNILKINYVKEDTQEVIDYTVPFFIDLGIGTNDRFYRDFYYKDEYCNCTIINNYDTIPRCHVTPSGITMVQDQVTSPFGMAEFTETINGKEQWVSSFVHMLPVSIDLSFSVRADTFTELLKIWQELIDYTLYSMIPSNFVYKGLNCVSTIIIEVPSIDNTFEFTAEDVTDELMTFEFTGRLETFYPAIKDKFINGITSGVKNNVKIEGNKVDDTDIDVPK